MIKNVLWNNDIHIDYRYPWKTQQHYISIKNQTQTLDDQTENFPKVTFCYFSPFLRFFLEKLCHSELKNYLIPLFEL